jgi:hypothetical protein
MNNYPGPYNSNPAYSNYNPNIDITQYYYTLNPQDINRYFTMNGTLTSCDQVTPMPNYDNNLVSF